MNKYFLVAILLLTGNVYAATAVFDGGGQLIGFDSVNVTGFGFYDTRFHDKWRSEDIYSQAFVEATGAGVLNDFTSGGVAQGSVIDYQPELTLGCESTSLCYWHTAYGFFSSGDLKLGTFTNYNENSDLLDSTELNGLHRFIAEDGSTTRTFLSWAPSNNVSAVPVPAALFMFAPALLGFLGLRRKTRA